MLASGSPGRPGPSGDGDTKKTATAASVRATLQASTFQEESLVDVERDDLLEAGGFTCAASTCLEGTNGPEAAHNRRRRGSVSGESINPSPKVADRIVFPKDDATKARIATAIGNNILFRNMDTDERLEIVDAMFERKVKKDEVIVKQCEEGDNFYVIDRGAFFVYVKKGSKESRVVTIMQGGTIGELALMYNTPRAATVVAAEDGVLWAVDRVTFQRSLANYTLRKRKMYENFLALVPFLSSLDRAEIGKIADVLESVEYEDGKVILAQGAAGDRFYLVESGQCKVAKTDERGVEEELPSLRAGDYFGEMAFTKGGDRAAATISAKGFVKLLVLSREAFVRLLGPLMDLAGNNRS